MAILLKDLPKEDLPRERLLNFGEKALSNRELLAIILRTGSEGQSANELADRILEKCKDVSDLKYLSINKLKEIRGLGPAKSISLKAALELGRRVYESKPIERKEKISNAIDVYRYFAKYIIEEKQENFMAIFLDTQRRYISHKIIFKGTLDTSICHPREVFKEAIIESASAIIVMHNHPSGDVHPSKADDEITRNLIETGETIGIPLLDHLVVSNKDYYSYIEEGRIRYEEN